MGITVDKDSLWRNVLLPLIYNKRTSFLVPEVVLNPVVMSAGNDQELLRSPDEDSGPAFLDREPVVLPEQRKQFVNRVRERLQNR